MRYCVLRGFTPVVQVSSTTRSRRPKTLVPGVVPDQTTDPTAAVEEYAVVGAGGVRIAVAAMLPKTVWSIVAVEDSERSGRATWL